ALVLLGCCVGALVTVVQVVEKADPVAGGTGAVDCTFQQVGCVVAVMAETLEDHVWGPELNHYDTSDPVGQPAYRLWLAECGGTLCSDITPGNLQCVKFVEGVFDLAQDTLPAHPDAIQFWSSYAHLNGWSEIGSTYYPSSQRGWPQAGD